MMKKYLLTTLVSFCVLPIFAQQEVRQFSILPRVGVNIANISHMDVSMGMNLIKSASKAGFTGGVEAEYQLSPSISASLALFYSMQGCHYPDAESSGDKVRTGRSDNSIDVEYINVPLMGQWYVGSGLALKAGFETGFLLSARQKYEEVSITIDEDGRRTYGVPTTEELNLKDAFNAVNVYIPVGISYEYMNVVLDGRYHFPLSRALKANPMNERHRFFTFSVGYRFSL